MVERGDTRADRQTSSEALPDSSVSAFQGSGVFKATLGAVLHPEGKNADNHQTVKSGHNATECAL